MKKVFNQIAEYFFLKKKDPNSPSNTNIKLMHGMNRISIILFFVAVLLVIWRLFFR